MRTNETYTNEFTGEIFSNKDECLQAEKESKKDFIKNLIADIELIKDICNSHHYCEYCPLNNGGNGGCMVCTFTVRYRDIVNGLRGIND